MNRILSLIVLLAFTTMAQAQSPYLPYNPDENADGLIGVADLQGLLSAYGSEFSSAILSDNGNIAVVEVGQMKNYECHSACASLPGAWSMVDRISAGLIRDQVSGRMWIDLSNEGLSTTNGRYMEESGYISVPTGTTQNSRACCCSAKQRPRVEYTSCTGGSPTETAFNQCINEKLAEGWYPLSGFPNHHDKQGYAAGAGAVNNGFQQNTHASFWRWEQ